MSSKRALRRRSCKGKIRYATVQQAASEAHLLTRDMRTGEQWFGYRCGFCGGAHVGRRMRH